jgi:hypothetical protein
MMLLGKIALGTVGVALVAGMMAFSEGAITVQVNDHRREGRNVNLFLPAAVVPVALRMVPAHHFGEIPPQARRLLPAVREAMRRAADLPDFVLVEVDSPRERVRIEKKGSRLLIHVEERNEEVFVAVPLRTLARTLREIERAAERNAFAD